MVPDYKNLLKTIHQILILYPEGLSEYSLLGILREKKIKSFKEGDLLNPMILFRSHFLLFHLLYRLRDQLRIEKLGDIEIHCLKIIISPWKHNTSRLLDHPDSLRVYYLNLNELESVTREDVENMLNWFWDEYKRDTRRDEALSIFKLKTAASPNTIKRRYRELVLRHHPDRGGDPEHFIRIRNAAEVLLN